MSIEDVEAHVGSPKNNIAITAATKAQSEWQDAIC
jgi:hypothetical protein